MAHSLTVAEAEAAYLEDIERKKLAKQRSNRRKLWISASFVTLTIGSLILMESGAIDGMRWLGIAPIIFSMVAAVLSMDVLMNSRPAGSWEALNALRASQRSWIESHGFKIPIGAFEQLAFAVVPERGAEQTYGVAQLIETSTDRLLSISLRSDAEGNYKLFGTDGEILKPVLATV